MATPATPPAEPTPATPSNAPPANASAPRAEPDAGRGGAPTESTGAGGDSAGETFRNDLLAQLSDARVVGELGRAMETPVARVLDRSLRQQNVISQLSDPVAASEVAGMLLDPLLRLLENHFYKERDRRSLLIDGHLH